jgi:hypothetical protein
MCCYWVTNVSLMPFVASWCGGGGAWFRRATCRRILSCRCIYICMHVCVCVCVCMCVCVCVCVCVRVWYVSPDAQLQVYDMRMCVCVCVCVFMHIYLAMCGRIHSSRHKFWKKLCILSYLVTVIGRGLLTIHYDIINYIINVLRILRIAVSTCTKNK